MSATCGVAVNLDLTPWLIVGLIADGVAWAVMYLWGRHDGRRGARRAP